MRLIELTENVYEVHEHYRMIGRVWRHDNAWHAELKSGTRVPGVFATAKDAGVAVARANRK